MNLSNIVLWHRRLRRLSNSFATDSTRWQRIERIWRMERQGRVVGLARNKSGNRLFVIWGVRKVTHSCLN